MKKTRLTSLIIASLLFSVTESYCTPEYDKGCISMVTCPPIDTVFTIYYINQRAEEIVAACDWVRSGSFSCDETKDYDCDAQPGKNVSLKIHTEAKCLKEAKFVFDVAQKDPILCTIPEDPQTRENTASTDKTSTTENQANKNDSPQDSPENSKQEIDVIGLAIGVSLVIAGLVAVAVLAFFLAFFNRNRLQKLWNYVNAGKDKYIKSKDRMEALIPLNFVLTDDTAEKK